MKKLLIFCLISSGSLIVHSQRIDEYKAENGITYHERDTIKLGRGSAPNGGFLYLRLGGFAAVMNHNPHGGQDQFNIDRKYANTAVILKKIHQYKVKGSKKIFFTVGIGAMSNLNLQIEEAIQTCEVFPCTSQQLGTPLEDKYDKIKKLKILLDSGAITQAEFDLQKKALLEGK